MRARVVAGLALAFSLAIPAGARAADDYTPPSTEAFLRSIRSYPHVAAAARRETIRKGVPQLARCMPATQVRKLIGDPDFGYVAYREGTSGKVPSKQLWNYILEKKAATETEPGSRVVIWLDTGGKLQAVTIHGAPDIEHTISRRSQQCPQP